MSDKNSYWCRWSEDWRVSDASNADENAYLQKNVFQSLNNSELTLAVFKGAEWRGSIPFYSATKDDQVSSSPISYAQGMLLSKKQALSRSSRTLSEQGKMWRAVASFLSLEGVKRIDFNTSYSELDVRPIVWALEDEHFMAKASPRYSATIDGLAGMTDENLLGQLRAVRRQELRKAKQRLIDVEEVSDEDYRSVIEDYTQFLERDDELGENVKTELAALNRVFRDGSLRIRRYLTDMGSRHFAGTIQGESDMHLVLSFTSNNIEKDINISTLANFEEIRRARNLGLRSFDFDGANSRHRGDDKHSYGARPKLFFHVGGGK